MVFVPSKSGGMSTGQMVAVHDARSADDAQRVVRMLEAHAIPAMLNEELGQQFALWEAPLGDGTHRVLVPSMMLPSAIEILHHSAFLELDAGLLRETEAWPSEDEDDRPIELELPAPTSLERRLVPVLLAIAVCGIVQGLLGMRFGADRVVAQLAVHLPLGPESWRLVTGGLIHANPVHFFGNAALGLMLATVLFGTHLAGPTILVWLLSSGFGLGAEALLSDTHVHVLGASAGNYGLVGLWARGQLGRAEVSLLSGRERMRTVGLLLLLVPMALTPITTSGAKVAVVAHLVGFLVAFFAGGVFRRRLLPENFDAVARRARVAWGLAVLLIGGAVTSALVQSWALARV